MVSINVNYEITITAFAILLIFLAFISPTLIIPGHAVHFGKITIITNVDAGRGNSSHFINKFFPTNQEINVNSTVKWMNPTVGEPYPHTITFIGNQSSSLLKSEISNITRLLQSATVGPVTNLIKFYNDSTIGNDNLDENFVRSVFFPSVINSSGLDVTYLVAPSHHMTGNESFLNSGFIWPEGQTPNGFYMTSFSVTFLNPGTYHYKCLIHPDMNGTITVKPAQNPFGIKIN